MNRFVHALLVALSLFYGSESASATSTDQAKVVFDRYVELERSFDPAVADLYADDALIKNKRTYPTGQERKFTIPASKYKVLIRLSMPLAKVRSDTNSYSNVSYTKESNGVRVHASRFSTLKKYSSPLSLLIAPDKFGRWLIHEEISESQP